MLNETALKKIWQHFKINTVLSKTVKSNNNKNNTKKLHNLFLPQPGIEPGTSGTVA